MGAGVKPYVADPDFTLYVGDALTVLRELPTASLDCCITSPPYWGLRDYGTDGQLGLESTPDEYVARMVDVFHEVRRVLRDDGTLWLNLGDSYAGPRGAQGRTGQMADRSVISARQIAAHPKMMSHTGTIRQEGLKPKDMVGIPWRVAFALQADGWYLRSDIIWIKPNPMPESVTDRPTKAHEYVFLLAKSASYYFDQEAVRETQADGPMRWGANGKYADHAMKARALAEAERNPAGRNVRSVWEIATQPYAEAHFATYPEELVRRCLLAGCPEAVCATCGKGRDRLVVVERTNHRPTTYAVNAAGGAISGGVDRNFPDTIRQEIGWSDCGHGNYAPGVVLDPFMGSGTTALVARKHGRRSVGIELSPEYAALAARRLQQFSLLTEASA